MDCCICSPMASVFRPPRNTICASCYEGAKTMLDFVGKSQFGGCDGQVNDSIKAIFFFSFLYLSNQLPLFWVSNLI